jgi:hypothetical protein
MLYTQRLERPTEMQHYYTVHLPEFRLDIAPPKSEMIEITDTFLNSYRHHCQSVLHLALNFNHNDMEVSLSIHTLPHNNNNNNSLKN